MTIRELDAHVARSRALEHVDLQEITDSMRRACTAIPDYHRYYNDLRLLMALAYLVGAVDGKRHERAKRKPADPSLDKPLKVVDTFTRKGIQVTGE